MTEPTFDRDGQPTIETLEAIEKWPNGDLPALIEFCTTAWNQDYGRAWREYPHEGCEFHFATGGWSANESIILAMQNNFIFWSLYWKKSERGGKFVFEEPKK